DAPVARDEHGRVNPDPDAQPTDKVRDVGFRTHGKSKDHRPDLLQVVIGMAVTRTGIPVRVWCWPGNTNDSALIRQVKDEMRDWTLGRVVWVADGGFSSAANRRYLRRAGGHYIIGEKLRSGSAEATQALARQGRYCRPPNGPSCAGSSPPSPASTATFASPPVGCCASTRPPSKPRRSST